MRLRFSQWFGTLSPDRTEDAPMHTLMPPPNIATAGQEVRNVLASTSRLCIDRSVSIFKPAGLCVIGRQCPRNGKA